MEHLIYTSHTAIEPSTSPETSTMAFENHSIKKGRLKFLPRAKPPLMLTYPTNTASGQRVFPRSRVDYLIIPGFAVWKISGKALLQATFLFTIFHFSLSSHPVGARIDSGCEWLRMNCGPLEGLWGQVSYGLSTVPVWSSVHRKGVNS